MSADPFKTLRDRQLQYQAEPVVLVNPATGEAGAIRLSGSTLAEQLTNADAVDGVLTFAAAVEWVEIINEDPTNAGVFTVNGVSIRVPAEVATGLIRIEGTPSASVTVTGSTAYIVNRRS